MNSKYLINIVISAIILYYMYTIGITTSNFSILVTALLVIMILVNIIGFLEPKNAVEEGFNLGNINPEIIIDVANINNIRSQYNGAINNKIIFVNSGEFVREISGDIFGSIILEPHGRQIIEYQQPGNYSFQVGDVTSVINIKLPQFKLPRKYYDIDNTGFTKKYYNYNQDSIFRTRSYN